MTPEEFYKTQFTHPRQMDEYYKAGIRFSYKDMVKFAQDYHNEMERLRHNELEAQQRGISVSVMVSPQFCPVCSPDTWGNYKFIDYPAKTKCTSCGHEHTFDKLFALPIEDIDISVTDFLHRRADEKTAEVYFCTHCMAFNEEDCCCSENDEE